MSQQRCPHGQLREECSVCRDQIAPAQMILRPFAVRAADNDVLAAVAISQQPDRTILAVTLSPPIQCRLFQQAEIAWLDAEEVDLEEIGERVLVLLSAARLFIPVDRLTARESTSEGPPSCWRDHGTLSFDDWTLGCSRCRQYAHRCGSCMCDFRGGQNYLGQFVPPGPGLEVPLRDRSAFVMAADYLIRVVRGRSHQFPVNELFEPRLPATLRLHRGGR